MEDKIKQAAIWLQEQVEKNPYGETGVNLIIHDGKIIRVEKSIIGKSKADCEIPPPTASPALAVSATIFC